MLMIVFDDTVLTDNQITSSSFFYRDYQLNDLKIKNKNNEDNLQL
jgi:hypothetical protein